MKLLIINNYMDTIPNRLIECLEELDTHPVVIKYNELSKIVSINNYDAVILSGTSNYPAENQEIYKDEMKFIRNVSTPLLGICGGGQLLALTFGCKLKKMHTPVYGKKNITKIEDDFIFNDIINNYYFSRHIYIINKVSIEFKVLALYGSYPYLIKHKHRLYYGCQFHPERRNDGKQLLKNFIELARIDKCYEKIDQNYKSS